MVQDSFSAARERFPMEISCDSMRSARHLPQISSVSSEIHRIPETSGNENSFHQYHWNGESDGLITQLSDRHGAGSHDNFAEITRETVAASRSTFVNPGN
jgi:hypothetical protein